MQLGRPLWVDDPHFQILYHVRHTAVPRPGSDEQLRNLAGRVLGQRLDMAKPLWELYLVEGLEDDRWAIISKVHHCMVDGVAGTDLMQLMFDLDPDATPRAGRGLDAAAHARRAPAMMAGAVTDARRPPAAAARVDARASAAPAGSSRGSLDSAQDGRPRRCPSLAKQAAHAHRRARSTARSARTAAGRGPTASSTSSRRSARRSAAPSTTSCSPRSPRGFRDLLQGRGELSSDKLVVRSMVPVSVRRPEPAGHA